MKKTVLSLLAMLLIAINGFSQNVSWRSIDSKNIAEESKVARDSKPTEYLLYAMDFNAMKTALLPSPSRMLQGDSSVILTFPNALGELNHYKMYEASVLESGLSAAMPEIKSYVGKGIEDPTATIRITTTIFGFHGMIISGKNGTEYIDPYTKDLNTYVVYNKSFSVSSKKRTCDVHSDNIDNGLSNELTLARSSNSLFKTYRLAMSCTIEYAAFHITAAGLNAGTLAQKKAAVLAAMAVTVARINSVYERDLTVTLVLINANLSLINVTSDTLDNNNSAPAYPLLGQNQTFIDSLIPDADYDIGHVATTGGGGVASKGSVCTTGSKARGVTGLDSPVGDDYDIDFVAHEMGHQFGCDHTFSSSTAGNCTVDTRVATSSFEPGSGTTIMAYAGVCSPDDVQPHSDAYFHNRSLVQSNAIITTTGNCAVAVGNNNTPPVVAAQTTVTIPNGTAFFLTGAATDVDNPSGNQLTYCWEQNNFTSTLQPVASTNTAGASFRSLNPTLSPVRYFPKFTSVIANNLAPTWEVIPTVARQLKFSLCVRDNGGPLGGQTTTVLKTVNVAATGPFKVTSQTIIEGWPQNSAQTVTWDVAGSNAAPISTANVNIRLSTDGGLTFPIYLATNTPNDGSEVITTPNLVSTTCRLMVEAVDNIFYAVNKSNFYIGYVLSNGCTTYNWTTPYAIPDGSNTYTQKAIAIPAQAAITDVNVTVNATHPNLQNLQIGVSKPGLGLTNLFNQQCTGSANLNVVFDSQAPALVCASPTTGTYAPFATLAGLNTPTAAGNWIIGVRDRVAGNVGTINSFSIEICAETITPVNPMAVESFNFDNFAVFPNPNNGNFTVKFDSYANNEKINIMVNDIRGRKIFEKTYENSGLFSQDLSLDNVQAGIYLVTVKSGQKQIVKKIVVE